MISTPSLCIIHNPQAARGAKGGRWRIFHRLLKGHAEFRPSTEPSHAIALAEQAAREGFPTVAAAGGDGTVHEVANGILQSGTMAAMGVLPLGSGNDYAAMIGLPSSPYDVVERLLSEETWAVDVGEVTDERHRRRFFVNTLGVGLSGAVTWESSQLKSHGFRLRGLPLYGIAAVRAIWKSFIPVPAVLTLDEQPRETHILYMAVALGQCEGGGFVVAPEARLDDGLFDILQAGKLSRLSALGYIPRLAAGWLPESNGTIYRGQCRSVALTTNQPFFSHTDGELLTTPMDGVCSLQVRLLPHALRIRGVHGS